jgi:hypothetical protein
VPLEVTEDLLAERVRDLGVDARVGDLAEAKVVRHVLDPAAGLEEVDRDRLYELCIAARASALIMVGARA